MNGISHIGGLSVELGGADQALPVLIEDNPSRDYAFPVSAAEVASALAQLPASHREGITHIWLRRRTHRRSARFAPLAEYICGGGVRLIVLYAWRKDGVLCLGRSKPLAARVTDLLRCGGVLRQRGGAWQIQFDAEGVRRYYLEHLLCHEVGHHVDWYNRHWSRANRRQMEAAADQYAYAWGPLLSGSVDPAGVVGPHEPEELEA